MEFPNALFSCLKNKKKHRVTIPCKRSFDFTWNPHEIWRISCEIHPNWRVFAETSEFIRFWVDFTMKSSGFHHEIWWISCEMWNPPKLKSFCWNVWIYKVLGGFHMKSAGFHGEICRISWIMSFCVMIKYRSFDFRKTKKQTIQQKHVTYLQNAYIRTQRFLIMKAPNWHCSRLYLHRLQLVKICQNVL